ncbi:hypothetical protein VRB21_12630 [Pseudomonas poae]
MNADFSEIQEQLIKSSFDSVGVVQELCKQCCIAAGITETADETVLITNAHLQAALETKARDYGVRHIRNFESFVDIAKEN